MCPRAAFSPKTISHVEKSRLMGPKCKTAVPPKTKRLRAVPCKTPVRGTVTAKPPASI